MPAKKAAKTRAKKPATKAIAVKVLRRRSATRRVTVERRTRETDIRLVLDLDGRGTSEISTGVGFLDHMLTALAKHAGFDLRIACRGDLQVDQHHSVEDVGLVLGDALLQALGEKKGVARFGHAYVPLDEALARAVVDLSGRPYLCFEVTFPARSVGAMPTDLFEEFFRAFADRARMNLHLDVVRGRNSHHIAEAVFKATARALAMAVRVDPRVTGVPSTKGAL
jgi:imidazoleglycerol-phosphate dehydratase